jgi:uncharacterized HAD superfamily protein
MSKYCIDIDGVISKKLHWTFGDSYVRAKKMFLDIPVNKKVIRKINEHYDKGDTIILHTARVWHDYEVTVEWLKRNNVKYHTLIMAKPLADFYVDDRNLSVGDFVKIKQKTDTPIEEKVKNGNNTRTI